MLFVLTKREESQLVQHTARLRNHAWLNSFRLASTDRVLTVDEQRDIASYVNDYLDRVCNAINLPDPRKESVNAN